MYVGLFLRGQIKNVFVIDRSLADEQLRVEEGDVFGGDQRRRHVTILPVEKVEGGAGFLRPQDLHVDAQPATVGDDLVWRKRDAWVLSVF